MPETISNYPPETNEVPKKLRIAFLASHNGTDMRAIVEAINDCRLNADPVILISNNSTSPAIKYVEAQSPLTFPTKHISAKSNGRLKTEEEVDIELRDALQQAGADIVILCGWMKRVGPQTVKAFEHRILNVHPALLPDLQGHWGDSIYDVVAQRRRNQPNNPEACWTGVTIHLVDNEYDHGEHVRQAALLVEPENTLKDRTQALEKALYIQVLQDISNGIIPLPEKVLM